MKLIEANQFARDYFVEGSRPDLRTLRADVAANRLPGRLLGKRCYIDLDRLDSHVPPPTAPAPSSHRRV